jgi:ABC-type multidrug transport system ATPase subunit
MARTFQITSLFPSLSARENVAMASLAHSGASGDPWTPAPDHAAARERADALLADLGLARMADRMVRTLGYGEQRQLEIAVTLALEPSLLLLDEPTAGLDPEERVFFRDLLAEISRGRVVILSTHIVEDVERCCRRIGVLDRGELRFEGTPQELAAQANGRVWEATVEETELEGLIASRRVVSVSSREGRATLRLVSALPPTADSTPRAARLEDGYILLLEGRHEVVETAQ